MGGQFENAIHACMASLEPEKKIHIQIARKGKKIVVQCRNTCGEDVKTSEKKRNGEASYEKDD